MIAISGLRPTKKPSEFHAAARLRMVTLLITQKNTLLPVWEKVG
jgi:hypothetical protein